MSRITVGRVVGSLVTAFLGGFAAGAGAGQPAPFGPRAVALGNAYTGIADDATAVYWNPAGLAWIGNQEIEGTHANLFGSGIMDSHVAFVLPLSPSWAVAADGHHTGFDDSELSYGDTRFDLATGVKLGNRISIGANAKFLTRDVRLDALSVRDGDAFGLDLGVLAAPFPRLRLGATLHDLSDTRLHYSDGAGSSLAYDRNLRVGGALKVLKDALLAVDIDDRLHAGAEYSPIGGLDLRAGIEQDLENTGESPTYAVGAGIRAGIVSVDYALSVHPTLGETSHFGVSLGFNFNPARIRIEKVEAEDIFGSLQQTYAHRPFGTVRLRNLEDRPLTTKLSVFAPGLMDQSTEEEVVLRPKAALDVPLTAVFSDKLVERSGDRRVRLNVAVSYVSERLPRTERSSTQLIAYGPGAIRWSDGVAQAAAFVTQSDPVVADFAREACRAVAGDGGIGFRGRNIAYAAAIVDALGTAGLSYLPDPNTPFESSSRASGILDTVRYPRETLSARAGDCDDTTVLLSALLESVGVPTCFIDVPGHLFLLVGTGVHERNALLLGVDSSLYVLADGEVWIPIETTVMNKGFAQAWREGAEAYGRWAGRESLSLVPVDEAQARYEPATLPGPTPAPRISVEVSPLTARLRDDAASLETWRGDFLSARAAVLGESRPPAPEALDEVAHVYFMAGEPLRARELLARALAREPGSARYLNNLANTFAAQGKADGADSLYRAALAADSTDAGVWLNLGLTRFASGDSAGAGAFVSEALVRSGSYHEASRLLGLGDSALGVREGRSRLSAEEARELLSLALHRMPAAEATADSTRNTPPRETTSRKSKLRVAATRSGSEELLALSDFLYWKE